MDYLLIVDEDKKPKCLLPTTALNAGSNSTTPDGVVTGVYIANGVLTLTRSNGLPSLTANLPTQQPIDWAALPTCI